MMQPLHLLILLLNILLEVADIPIEDCLDLSPQQLERRIPIL
jgi:hypothetical protein